MYNMKKMTLNKNINIFFTTVGILLFSSYAFAQNKEITKGQIADYFEEVKLSTKKHQTVWDVDLYGPILIVNPYNRKTYSNYPDTTGILKKEGNIYIGELPKGILLGNVTTQWGGRKWAMVLTIFLKDNKEDRVDLFTHELFHRAQSSLGFKRINDLSNGHLDSKEGRIFLRLELEALLRALKSDDDTTSINHIHNALIFRKYRYQIFENAYKSEATIEINEGIASYTGKVMRGLTNEENTKLMQFKIEEFISQPSYVQLFAYQTIPAYGFVLKRTNPKWNKMITSDNNLTDFFNNSFSFDVDTITKDEVNRLSKMYNGEIIIEEETKIEVAKEKTIIAYKFKFFESPSFTLPFENKRVSYDTRYIITIEDYGFVYPTMIAKDNWGILEVKEVGGLLNKQKDKVIITTPTSIDGNKIEGVGWKLIINDAYTIWEDKESGNYFLKKK